MSYKTYTTHAIVCGSVHHNTSDKQFLLFTEDAGMIYASARSVREEKSKQRYALQDFSLVRVSLVKGKSGWRIGSAQALGNPFLQAQGRVARTYINFVVAQLRRYVHGEDQLPRTYDDVMSIFEGEPIADEQGPLLQQLFSLRLLYELGYVALHDLWKPIVDAHTVRESLRVYTSDMEGAIAKDIKTGTQASQL